MPCRAISDPPAKRLVGYYASWSAYGPFQVAHIPADRLTHVTYAFATLNTRHELVWGDPAVDGRNLAELALLKRCHPNGVMPVRYWDNQ
jgi:chitinase